MGAPRYSNLVLFRRLLREARPYWPHIGGLLVLNLLATPLALLMPLPLKIVVDNVIGSYPIPDFLYGLLPGNPTLSETGVLTLTVALIVIIALLSQLQKLGSSLLNTYTGEKLVLAFRGKLFRHVQRLSLSYHDTKGTTDSTFRMQYDAPAIQWILINGISPLITAGFTLTGMLYVTTIIDWQLALVALVISPVLFLISRAYGPRLRRQWHEVHKLQSSAMSVVQEVLAAVRVVKAFGQEDREQERFVHHASKGFGARLGVSFAEGGFGLMVGLTIAVGTAAVLFIGTHHVQSGALTLGELLLVMTYLTQIYGPLQTLSLMVAHLQRSLASAERTFALLDETPDIPDRPHARPLKRATGAIEFRHLSFAYDGTHQVLNDVSFCVKPGTRVGIAGMTGAGKTTLVSLLIRFYDPTTGQILLDGIDLRDYKLADLRHQFAIVQQEPVLFSTSIAENIAYARPGASAEEIVEAAKAASAHAFIVGLPDGYDARVGERGMQLSGGERQRIALARAFLKDAPLLILDEPTSAVDMKTEADIMQAMERLMHNRTTFIIAHRLNTLKNCGIRLQIEDGRLVHLTSSGLTDTSVLTTNDPYNVASVNVSVAPGL